MSYANLCKFLQIANTDFNQDSAESVTDQPAGNPENELMDETDTF